MFLPNRSLSILNVEEPGEGWYVCEAENIGGISRERVYLKVFLLPSYFRPEIVDRKPEIQCYTNQVGAAPEAHIRPEKLDFVAGGSMRLRCSATASPAATISWRKGGRELLPSHRISE